MDNANLFKQMNEDINELLKDLEEQTKKEKNVFVEINKICDELHELNTFYYEDFQSKLELWRMEGAETETRQFIENEKNRQLIEQYKMYDEEIYAQRNKDFENDLIKEQNFKEFLEILQMSNNDKYVKFSKENIVFELNCLLNKYFFEIRNNIQQIELLENDDMYDDFNRSCLRILKNNNDEMLQFIVECSSLLTILYNESMNFEEIFVMYNILCLRISYYNIRLLKASAKNEIIHGFSDEALIKLKKNIILSYCFFKKNIVLKDNVVSISNIVKFNF